MRNLAPEHLPLMCVYNMSPVRHRCVELLQLLYAPALVELLCAPQFSLRSYLSVNGIMVQAHYQLFHFGARPPVQQSECAYTLRAHRPLTVPQRLSDVHAHVLVIRL